MEPKPLSPLKRIIAAGKSLAREAAPGRTGMVGAALGMIAAAGLVYGVFVTVYTAGPLAVSLPSLVVFLALGGLLLFFGQGAAWLIQTLARIPWTLRWAMIGSVALIIQSTTSFKPLASGVLAAYVLLFAALLGMGAWQLLRERAELARPRRIAAAAALAVGAAGLAAGLAWYAGAGTPAQEIADGAASGQPLERIALPDPGQPGPYAVKTLTYGAGTDRFRPEYGKDAALITEPVSGTRLLGSSWNGIWGQLRTLMWGIAPENLPLNGRVWYPDGEGPFPLALVVHGNHTDMDFSDPGYDYLGELMASRGFIFVSVDENFLNGGVSSFINGMNNENDARGWLLLEHLRVWHAWNSDRASPFYGKVDTSNLAVMGHSRGGEAAAVAAAFNRLPYYPDDSNQVFKYNYNIRAVVAIAPIDGQYTPAGRGTTLTDVNYFVLHGSHDGDADSFDGINQYERVRFTGVAGFKAALYIYRANHGQFNTTWGQVDRGTWPGLVNRAALLTEAEQEQAAKVYISAFLEAALRGQAGYLPLFQDARSAGDGWLPQTIYVNRLDRAGDIHVATFDEDADLQTGTLPGSAIRSLNMDTWREDRIHSKWGGTETNGVYLGWNEDSSGALVVYLPPGGLLLTPEDALIFNIADAKQDPPPAPSVEGSQTGPGRQPIDLTVVLEDGQGQQAHLPLSRYRMVQPQLDAQVWKLKLIEKNAPSEPAMQSIVIPLADFAQANPAFDPQGVTAVRFIFDRTKRGSVIIDAVGFRPR